MISESDGNTIIKNNDEGAEENPGTRQIVIENWDKVDEMKDQYPDLLIPEYVPEGYEFRQLVIEDTGMIESYVFVFANKEETLEITESLNTELTIFNRYDRIIEGADEDIYVNETDDKIAILKKGSVSIYIIGKEDDYEIRKIVEHFK